MKEIAQRRGKPRLTSGGKPRLTSGVKPRLTSGGKAVIKGTRLTDPRLLNPVYCLLPTAY